MCGIAGYFRLQPDASAPLPKAIGDRMIGSMERRGPDGEGQWRSDDGLCWLGHRRLAIIDRATGAQPMSNEDGSLRVTYNGEIYNYRELRAELQSRGHRFKTASDTEVLVHGYEEWGGEDLARRLRGIFAFGIYDSRAQRLFLARDHLGVKPLYWWSDGSVILFASEIKALLPYPGLRNRQVNRAGVAQFLVSRYVSRPHSMFEGVYKLPEACTLEISRGRAVPHPRAYWDLTFESQPRRDDFRTAVDELDELLTDTVRMQLVADVPVGAQLSGGVDSSVIVALMDKVRRLSGMREPIKTFSVGFDVERYNELDYARLIADRYHTDHQEIRVGHRDFIEHFPLLCWVYDEPIGEPPAIPTYFMCRQAKESVTVMLCGEGADEQFGGYRKYAFDGFSPAVDWLPKRVRRGLLRTAAARLPFRARRLRSVLEILALADPSARFASWYGAMDTTLQAELLRQDVLDEVGDRFLTHVFEDLLDRCDSANALERFLYCDVHTRLVDDLLVKGDRMSMGASIEARVPFLDPRVVEFAASLVPAFKVSGLRTKILLKKLAERYAPPEAIYRRKVGFTVPLTDWFVGPLRDFVRGVLLSERCLARGYWRPDAVARIVNEHLDRRVDREQAVWSLLALEVWHRLYVDADGSERAVEQLNQDLARQLHASSVPEGRRRTA